MANDKAKVTDDVTVEHTSEGETPAEATSTDHEVKGPDPEHWPDERTEAVSEHEAGADPDPEPDELVKGPDPAIWE